MKNISNITLAILMAAGAATLQNCGSSKAKEEEAEEKKTTAAAPAVEGFVLKKGQLSSDLHVPGELIAFQQVDLYAKVSSFVKKMHVDVGTEVRQGQLLASMEAPELSAQYTSSTSKLKAQEAIYLSSKASYNRLLETSKTPGTVSQNDLDLALAKQNSDLAQLEAARSASKEISDTRNYLEIRAPFSGVISARNVSAGAFVGPSGKGSEFPLFTLVEKSKLRLVVSVPEAYSSYLTSKSTVSFKVKALPNEDFPAKVARMSGALDARLRAQRVEMDVNNSNGKLLPGMIAEVSIPLSRGTDSYVVPKSAVLNSTQGTYLVRVENQKAVWVPVTAGTSADGKTEIFGNVKEGDVFLKTVTEEVRENSEIKNIKTVSL
ncbi:efflux RND transporter periplasmic adaptor subunit [Dyadobacter psychrotolerans]|uniref:Efflux RND transporter periplasmic adaptor subunit n=1 Tax=Dyadobacter psychrotolerans TaxID=2541721 RepID=A0A4R5E124_9BACT|nr:efflux RND transporter periplasmic adaptor subunit [Dyadobacter psychrotolerans]TDE17585.1 efflux RND transporter periplasmic adaptor subunit [Dyadobacter psychrotolerans]